MATLASCCSRRYTFSSMRTHVALMNDLMVRLGGLSPVLVERKRLERANFFAFNIEKHEVYVKHVVLSEHARSGRHKTVGAFLCGNGPRREGP